MYVKIGLLESIMKYVPGYRGYKEKELPADYMLRFESKALIDEVIENTIGKEIINSVV